MAIRVVLATAMVNNISHASIETKVAYHHPSRSRLHIVIMLVEQTITYLQFTIISSILALAHVSL